MHRMADRLLLAGFLGRFRKRGLRNGHHFGESLCEALKWRLTRFGRWDTVRLQFSGHGSLRVGCFLAETPSASCTLAQGEKHV